MRQRKPSPELEKMTADLTPMIDVTFLLLIFFLLNLQFQVAEGEVEQFLPKGQGQNQGRHEVKLDELRLKLLWCDREGQPTRSKNGRLLVKIGRRPLNDGTAASPAEVDRSGLWKQLYETIVERRDAAQRASKEELEVIIDAREHVPYRYVVRALNELIRAGIKEIRFAAPSKPI
jgi:biopolymer transport protein ExbD